MATKKEELGHRIYQDELIELSIGVNVKTDTDLGRDIEYHRVLDNCIKIKALTPDAHFIQFVTKQHPDMYTLHTEGKLQWEQVEPHYMTDIVNPKWKLDVTAEATSVFYDEDGLHSKTEAFVAMYDYPGGNAEPSEERGTFCTFVIINAKITHLVRWSKQFVGAGDGQEAYAIAPVQRLRATTLPCWAMRAMQRRFDIADENTFPPLKIFCQPKKLFKECLRQKLK